MVFSLLGNPEQLQSFSHLVLGFLFDSLWLLGKEVLLSQLRKFNLNYVGICIYSFTCIISNSTRVDNMIPYDIFRHSYCCFILSPSVLSLSPSHNESSPIFPTRSTQIMCTPLLLLPTSGPFSYKLQSWNKLSEEKSRLNPETLCPGWDRIEGLEIMEGKEPLPSESDWEPRIPIQ